MKKSLIILLMLLATTAIISCERNAFDLGSPLSSTKTSMIQKGEPVQFTFQTQSSTDEIQWKVTPGRNVRINSSGRNATISFSESGNYIVTATDQINSARSAVTVDTVTYAPADTATVIIPLDTIKTGTPDIPVIPPAIPVPTDTVKVAPVDTVGTHNIYLDLKNDTFVFSPSIVDTLSNAGLMINIQSSKSYKCLNSYLMFNPFFQIPSSKVFKLNLNAVVQPGERSCQEGTKKISATTFLYPLAEGSNKIEIILNGTIYNGTVTRTGKNFTIDWPDSREIRFSKLTLTQ
jgi:hypothetical protein